LVAAEGAHGGGGKFLGFAQKPKVFLKTQFTFFVMAHMNISFLVIFPSR
jgi:hypothetical protein